MEETNVKLENLSAIELGELVNSKVVSPVEVIDYFIKRIEKWNFRTNAFVYTKYDEAHFEAVELEKRIMNGEDVGPLAGVPIGLKDFLPTKKGWTASHGGVKSLITVDQEDDIFYSTAHKLGAIAIGKTNAPSFGFRGTTDNKMYGPTSTPFKVGYNSGGSSGGSAAAVAAGLVPVATSGDGGGSSRIPAAWCNCFGFKPSAGVNPSICRPDAWTATHPYCCSGVETRTILDSAIIFESVQSYDPKDPISVPLAKKPLSKLMCESISGMKIAVTHDYNIFPSVNAEILTAVDRTAEILQSAGAIVDYVDFKFKFSLDEMIDQWLLGISIDDAVSPEIIRAVDEHPEDMPDEFIYWHMKARKATMLDYRKFHEVRTDILDAHLNIFKDYDIVLSPVTCCMPVPNATDHNTLGPEEIDGCPLERLIGYTQTWFQNMTGNPSASIPTVLSKEGFPIGVQVTARRYLDENVFKIAHTLEQLQPWAAYYERSFL